MPKILVIQVAGLGWALWERAREATPNLGRLAAEGQVRQLRPPFPAVTVTCQATFTTGTPPARHGMVSNGLFHRDLMRAMFWEQSSALVQGETIGPALKARRPHATTAMLFWQNSIGSGHDVILTPAPIHKHGHGIIDSCYSVPAGLYDRLAAKLGAFKLRWYWGPFVSLKGSEWITRATIEVLRELGPHLCLTYLPHLDYEQQRLGPDHPAVLRDAAAVDDLVGDLVAAARELDYAVLVWGDYAIEPVNRVVAPNLILREAGLLNVRRVKGREYLDLGTSTAFAMVDHQVAHVYALQPRAFSPQPPVSNQQDVCHRLSSTGAPSLARVEDNPWHPQKRVTPAAGLQPPTVPDACERVREVFERYGEGLGVVDPAERGLEHPRCGEVVLEAAEGTWFDYRWWRPGAAPDFAGHVDIHNKPGFDPCELFTERLGLRTGTDPTKVRGSHGRPAPAVVVADGVFPLPAGDPVPLEALKAMMVDVLTGPARV